MKTLFITVCILMMALTQLFGQTILDTIKNYTCEIDSLEQNKYLNCGISEGDILVSNGVGSGGFSLYVNTRKDTKELVLGEYNRTIHYGFENDSIESPNSIRFESRFYYMEDKLVYVQVETYHYNGDSYYDLMNVELFFINNNLNLFREYYSQDLYDFVVQVDADIRSFYNEINISFK